MKSCTLTSLRHIELGPYLARPPLPTFVFRRSLPAESLTVISTRMLQFGK
jgi:hypothetical protein